MLLALLRESRERFLGSFAGVSDEQSRLRPSPDCWSVLDTVEHLTSAEGIMLKLVTPEGGRPCGRFANLAAAAAQFKASRDETIHFVEQNTEDLRATEVTHPHPMAGNVSSYEMVIIMAKHAERHAKQIEEIRNSLSLHADAAKGKS